MNNKPSKEVKSAIIGYYRGGSPIEQISHVANVRYQLVKSIIMDYLKNNPH